MAKNPSKQTLVVDLGYQLIRLVHIERINNSSKIRNVAVCRIDSMMTEEQKRSSLQEARSSLKLKGNVRVVVPWDDEMTFKQLALPDVPKEDFKRAFDWELNNKYFINPDEHLIAYEYLTENEVDGGGKEKFYSVFYCQKPEVMGQLQFLRSAGIEVDEVVPICTALAELTDGGVSDCLIFHIGHQHARIVIVQDKKVFFSRSLSSGGWHLTEMMTAPILVDDQRIQYDMNQAEKIKVEQGVQDPQSAHVSLIRPYLDKMVSEIKRSIDFYEAQKYSRPVKKVIFTGGGSELKGLLNFMAQFLEVETLRLKTEEHLSPDIDADKKNVVLQSFGSFEPALGAASVPVDQFNLLPAASTYQKRNDIAAVAGRLAVLACAIVLIFASVWFAASTHVVHSQMRSLVGESNEINRMNELMKNIGEYERFKHVALKGSLSHAVLLKVISRAIPASIYLDKLEYDRDDQTVMMHGFASTASGADLKAVTEFVNQLSKVSFFENAALVNSSKPDGMQGSSFEIKCVMKGQS